MPSLTKQPTKKVAKVANEYKGGISALPIPSDWSDISELLPFIFRIIVSILAIYLARQFFGGFGAMIVAALVTIWWLGPMIGISL